MLLKKLGFLILIVTCIHTTMLGTKNADPRLSEYKNNLKQLSDL